MSLGKQFGAALGALSVLASGSAMAASPAAKPVDIVQRQQAATAAFNRNLYACVEAMKTPMSPADLAKYNRGQWKQYDWVAQATVDDLVCTARRNQEGSEFTAEYNDPKNVLKGQVFKVHAVLDVNGLTVDYETPGTGYGVALKKADADISTARFRGGAEVTDREPALALMKADPSVGNAPLLAQGAVLYAQAQPRPSAADVPVVKPEKPAALKR